MRISLANSLLESTEIAEIYLDENKQAIAVFRDLEFMEILNRRKRNAIVFVECSDKKAVKSHALISMKDIREQVKMQFDEKLTEYFSRTFYDIYVDEVHKVCNDAEIPFYSDYEFELEATDIDDMKLQVEDNFEVVIENLHQQYPKKINKMLRKRLPELLQRRMSQESAVAINTKNEFERFINGRGSFKLMKSLINWKINFGTTNEIKKNNTFGIELKLKKHLLSFRKPYMRIEMDTIQVQMPDTLKNCEFDLCTTVSRVQYLLDLLKDSVYLSRNKSNFEFDVERNHTTKIAVYFMQNDKHGDKRDIKRLTNFVADTCNVFNAIDVCGYTSVEGDSTVNHSIQEKRAKYIGEIVEKHIHTDTIELTNSAAENWELFNKQVQYDENLEMWRNLSKTEVKQLLADSYWGEKMAPVLAMERYVKVSMDTYRNMPPDEIIESAETHIKQMLDSVYYLTGKADTLKHFARQDSIITILNRLETEIENNTFTRNEVNKNTTFLQIPEYYVNTYLRMINAYDTLNYIPKSFGTIDTLANKAFEAANKLMKKYEQTDSAQIYYNIVLYIQQYNYKLINDRILPLNNFCEWKYKSAEQLSSYYSFVNNYADQAVIDSIPCANRTVNDEIVDERESRKQNYLYLKNYFKHVHKRKYKDATHGSKLYRFLKTNIENWDVNNNVYFDEDYPIGKLSEYADELLIYEKGLCKNLMWELLLDFYRKSAIHYASRKYRNPDKLNNMLSKINNYYISNLQTLTIDDVTDIVAINASFNHALPREKKVYKKLSETMSKHFNKKSNGSIQYWKLYSNFMIMYKGNHQLVINDLKEELDTKTFEALFSGKYNIKK